MQAIKVTISHRSRIYTSDWNAGLHVLEYQG
jgi:hypothetical protein